MGRAQDQIFWSASNALCDFGKGTPLSGPQCFHLCAVRPGCPLRPCPPLFPFPFHPKPLRTGDGLKGWLIHELSKVVRKFSHGRGRLRWGLGGGGGADRPLTRGQMTVGSGAAW